MAQAFDKLARVDDAIEHYEEYLKILPTGPQAEEAKKALEKLRAISEKNQAQQ
jgi:tetratricopeptide (TPR) repeat protein